MELKLNALRDGVGHLASLNRTFMELKPQSVTLMPRAFSVLIVPLWN